jgi:hypothetical protein
MGARRWGVAAAVAVAGAAVLARGAAPGSIGLSVSITGPREAEMSSWTDVRVELENAGSDPAQAHVTFTLPEGTAQPSGADGAQCAGTQVVECDQTVPGGKTTALTVPVRWGGTGSQMVSVQARAQSGGSTAEASASSSISVYALTLDQLKTTAALAGKPFVATATLERADSGQELAARALRCSAVLAAAPKGKALATLRGAATVKGSDVTCTWRLPANAHNRYVRALMLADTHAGGMLTKRPLLRRVR